MQGAGRWGWFGREGGVWESLAWWRAVLPQEERPPLETGWEGMETSHPDGKGDMSQ